MIRNSSGRATRAAFAGALAAGLLVAAANAASADGSTGVVTKKKPATVVNVVVGDTEGLDGPMTMTVTPASAPAGKVKFAVENQGTIIHEVVVLKTKTAFDELPVTKDRVSEAKAVGEVADVGKGKTKSKTLKLKPGSYVLLCNIAGHYGLGMRAAFTVT